MIIKTNPHTFDVTIHKELKIKPLAGSINTIILKIMINKRIFVSCPIEDEQTRGLFSSILHYRAVSHCNSKIPAMQPLNDEHKATSRATIKACQGVIALISTNAYTQRELWEIKCAHEENIPLIGFYINGATSINKPSAMGDVICKNWTWNNVNEFIDSL